MSGLDDTQNSIITAVASDTDTGADDTPLYKTVLYSLGNAAGLITYNVFNTFIGFFYSDVVALPATWVGRGLFAFGFWNAINDPISGWISDRTRSAFGRRRFYIRALAIPVAIAFALVWLPPLDVREDGAVAVMVYFLVIISIYDLFQSIITLNQDALFPELYPEKESRARSASIRQTIGGIGTGISVAMTPWLYGSFGWSAVALVWGSLSAVLHLLSLLGIDEHPEFAGEADPSLREQLRVLAENHIFRILIGVNFVSRFILAVLTQSLPFYAKYVLRIDENQTGWLIAALTGTGIVSLFFWQYLFRRWGTRSAMMVSLGLGAIVAIPLMFVQGLTGTLILLSILGLVVGGTFFLGPDLLFAELIEEDFVRTGVRREGIYRGLLGFVFRFPNAFAGLILLQWLASSGYDADLAVNAQPNAVPEIIRIFMVVGFATAVIAGIVLLWIYPLYGERLEQVQQRSYEMRAAIKKSAHLSD
ncbi:MAG TPA: MFS transporter [Aggregatilineales bacterium]|nr:MFS transporter [Aggregatilineales bacterium]